MTDLTDDIVKNETKIYITRMNKEHYFPVLVKKE